MIFFFAKIGIFCMSIAGPLSEAKTQLALTPEPIEHCMALYQALYVKFIKIMSPKCSIVDNEGELMLMALHTYFLLQQQYSQYSRVYALFLAFHALVYRLACQFFSLFSQDN